MPHDPASHQSIQLLFRPLFGLALLLGGCQSTGIVGTLYQASARGVAEDEPPVPVGTPDPEGPAAARPSAEEPGQPASPGPIPLLPPLEVEAHPVLPLLTPGSE